MNVKRLAVYALFVIYTLSTLVQWVVGRLAPLALIGGIVSLWVGNYRLGMDLIAGGVCGGVSWHILGFMGRGAQALLRRVTSKNDERAD